MAKQREAVFHPHFLEDLRHWVETDRKLALRTLTLVEETLRDPFQGIGKPEPLKYLAPNTWSRRLTQEHRIVYLVQGDRVVFLQARYHYRCILLCLCTTAALHERLTRLVMLRDFQRKSSHSKSQVGKGY